MTSNLPLKIKPINFFILHRFCSFIFYFKSNEQQERHMIQSSCQRTKLIFLFLFSTGKTKIYVYNLTFLFIWFSPIYFQKFLLQIVQRTKNTTNVPLNVQIHAIIGFIRTDNAPYPANRLVNAKLIMSETWKLINVYWKRNVQPVSNL